MDYSNNQTDNCTNKPQFISRSEENNYHSSNIDRPEKPESLSVKKDYDNKEERIEIWKEYNSTGIGTVLLDKTYRITLGMQIISSKHFNTREEAEKYLGDTDWEMIIAIASAVNHVMNKETTKKTK